MLTSDNLIQQDDLYPRMLVLQVTEKTKTGTLIWNRDALTVFRTSWESGDRYYDVRLSYLRGLYEVDFSRNGRIIYTVSTVSVPEVAELYEVVSIVLGDNNDFLTPIQSQSPEE